MKIKTARFRDHFFTCSSFPLGSMQICKFLFSYTQLNISSSQSSASDRSLKMVLVTAVRDYLNRMLQDISGMKVLILDSHTVTTLSTLENFQIFTNFWSNFDRVNNGLLLFWVIECGAGQYSERGVFAIRASAERSVFGGIG